MRLLQNLHVRRRDVSRSPKWIWSVFFASVEQILTVDDVVVDIVGIDGYYQKKTCVAAVVETFLAQQEDGRGYEVDLDGLWALKAIWDKMFRKEM